MWKLWNLLFGWDYVVWRNWADQGVARVQRDELGAWYWRYKITNLADRIDNREQVIWLTCDSTKYMGAA